MTTEIGSQDTPALSIRDHYDVVVIGGGPAGTTFGQLMRRSGHDVLVLERARHPRFCVGESLLPATMPVWEELGLTRRFEEVRKRVQCGNGCHPPVPVNRSA